MSTENPAEAGDGNPSEKNERTTESVVAEFSRKTAKLAEENALLSQKLDQITNMIASRNQGGSQSSGQEQQEENLEDLIYKDPKAYARAVENRAVKRADEMVQSRMNTQNETQGILSQLAAEYPELNDTSSALTKRAVEIYNQLPPNQRANPLAYKIAVRDAAADMGVLTKNKRTKPTEDFVMDSSGSSGSASNKGAKSGEGKMDDKSLAFAELLGVNIKDEKVMKRLQERNKRKNWGTWS